MDRIRRSFRDSFRRRGSKDRTNNSNNTGGGNNTDAATVESSSSSSTKPQHWQPDEVAVRAGTCSFTVKYLGAVEVFESRGMQVCEEALKVLRSQRRRTVRGVLYISGDGLRVVDAENNRGLIVDQTIEKVSFCAPDRNNDKGFAYICRDGTTRRWMCHGFHATKEMVCNQIYSLLLCYQGERLSHAVGCAFAVCLEKKKKRDTDMVAVQQSTSISSAAPTSPTTDTNNSGTVVKPSSAGNFRRQLSITERLRDPQTAIVADPMPPPKSQPSTSARCDIIQTMKPRPAPNPALFERQGSLRAPDIVTGASAFRRQYSLRVGNLPSTTTIVSNHQSQQPSGSSQHDDWPSESTSTPRYHNGGSRNGTPRRCYPGQFNRAETWSSAIWEEDNGFAVPHPTSSNSGNKSRADEWLEQTLKSTLSLNNGSSPSPPFISGPPPDQPPPPLPDSRYGVERDSFGQPKFSAIVMQRSQNGGGLLPTLHEIDPFDLKWTAMDSSSPFNAESTSVDV